MSLSVIIPSYNGSRFIEEAIRSVLQQQQPPEEILVCDDNSTDNTLEICRRYEDRITLYTNPDGPSGFVNAWNRAISQTKGEYISILHQDDILDPIFTRTAMTALQAAPTIRHLFTTCQYIDEEGRPLSTSYSPGLLDPTEVRLTGPQYVRCYQCMGAPHIHRCPGVITHRSIFEQCRYEPSSGHIADDDFFYRVGMFTDVIGILQPLASFRLHDQSATGSLKDTALAGQLMKDYLYQCRQWKNHPFLNQEAYQYFVRHAHKYARRFLGYGLRQMNLPIILKGLCHYTALYGTLHLPLKFSGK